MKFQNILRLIRTIALLAVFLYFLERSDEFIEKFLAWCAVFIVFLAALLMRGTFILYSLNWFICEPFSIPLVGFAQALGIGMVFSYFATDMEAVYNRVDKEDDDDVEKIKRGMITGVVVPTIGFVMAWLVHLLM